MKSIISIDKINQLTKNDFIDIFGNVFEKTYWIANKAFVLKPYKSSNELLSTLIKIYEKSSKEDFLKIFNSHPELAVEKKLTDDSRMEQNNANLDQCSDQEFIEFTIAKEIIINVAMAITPLIKQIIFINNWLLCSSF